VDGERGGSCLALQLDLLLVVVRRIPLRQSSLAPMTRASAIASPVDHRRHSGGEEESLLPVLDQDK